MMKKNIQFLSLILTFTFLLNACGGGSSSTVDDSKWTAKDKENAINNCKFGRKNDDPAKVEKLCSCYLNKVISLSPNPVDQGKIPMNEVTKLNADCRTQAGL